LARLGSVAGADLVLGCAAAGDALDQQASARHVLAHGSGVPRLLGGAIVADALLVSRHERVHRDLLDRHGGAAMSAALEMPWELPTTPYQHQWSALDFCDGRSFYALLMEQGTGKSPVVIWDLARRFTNGSLGGALVMAPNGVQLNWVLRELPKHMPRAVPYQCAAWTSGMNKRQQAELDDMFRPGDRLRILTMNWEALGRRDPFDVASEFLKMLGRMAGMVSDESQRMKNYKAGRTKAAWKLKPLAQALRVLMSGTPILKSPWDAFAQFGWLSTNILQTNSYWEFKAQYAELLPPGHGLMRHITDRLRPQIEKMHNWMRVKAEEAMKEAEAFIGDAERKRQLIDRARILDNSYKDAVEKELARRAPQLPARDPVTNMPKWRNLDRLDALIDPHSFRVLKKDCLDLPDKVYVTRWFKMTAKQTEVQERIKQELRVMLDDGTILPLERLGALMKLSQVSSGYFLVPGTDVAQKIMPLAKNPKLAVLKEEVETCLDNGQSFIIWARFQEEIRDIAETLRELKTERDNDFNFVEYHGEVGSKHARQSAIDDFEAGRAQGFLSQQQAGGTGLTLIAAASMATEMSIIYYSNTFALEDRLQSEDRAHRIGQSKTARYVDILGEGTIDPAILDNLQAKIDIASLVTGDARRAAAAFGLAQ
jgi:hypothetical protein